MTTSVLENQPRIVLAGANSYLGRSVAEYFLNRGWTVVSLVRRKGSAPPGTQEALWDGTEPGPWSAHLEGADVLLNLAGRSVNCRYSKTNRQEMLRSRVESTRVLGQALATLKRPPKLWMNSSTATIYRDSLDRAQDDFSGEIGKGFSVEIAKAWERELNEAQVSSEVRRVALRTAMVFGPGRGGVGEAFTQIVRQRLGGRAGSGDQFISWIHLQDFLRALDFLIEHPEISGAVNLAAPDPRPNRDFMRTLLRRLGVSLGLPAPEWLLEIGAVFKRTETELLLKSRRVWPGRLLQAGFKFQYATWDSVPLDS